MPRSVNSIWETFPEIRSSLDQYSNSDVIQIEKSLFLPLFFFRLYFTKSPRKKFTRTIISIILKYRIRGRRRRAAVSRSGITKITRLFPRGWDGKCVHFQFSSIRCIPFEYTDGSYGGIKKKGRHCEHFYLASYSRDGFKFTQSWFEFELSSPFSRLHFLIDFSITLAISSIPSLFTVSGNGFDKGSLGNL